MIFVLYVTFLHTIFLTQHILFSRRRLISLPTHNVPLQIASDLYPRTSGGGVQLASDMNLPFLGKIPLDPRVGMSCDQGLSFYEDYPDIPVTLAYKDIVSSKS